jgi:hypothetical protein
MSTAVIGLFWLALALAAVAGLHLLDRRLAVRASRQWEQARHAARISGLADRRPQDELEGWR